MDKELRERCNELPTKGMPNVSDPRAAYRGDDTIFDILPALSARVHRQISGMFDTAQRPHSPASSSDSSLGSGAVTDDVKNLRRIASRGNLSTRSHLSTRSQSQPLSARSQFSSLSRPEMPRSDGMSGKGPPLSARSELSTWRC